jgi:hypothetical protein
MLNIKLRKPVIKRNSIALIISIEEKLHLEIYLTVKDKAFLLSLGKDHVAFPYYVQLTLY